jgi:hypothetical protein
LPNLFWHRRFFNGASVDWDFYNKDGLYMETVEIWKRDRNGGNDSKLGGGDKSGATMTVQAWDERAGVVR